MTSADTADTADTASSITTSKRSTRRSRLQQASLFSLSFYTLFHNSNNHFAHGFTPSYSSSYSYSSSVVAAATRRESNGVFQLNAIDKSQTAIYDGAEFVSILSYLLTESNPRIRFEDEDDDTDDTDTDDTDISDDTTAISDDTDDSKKSSSKKGKDKEDEKKEPIVFLKSKNMPYKKAGFITFVTGSLNTNTNSDTNKKDERIIAVQSPIQPQPSQSQSQSDTIKGLTLLHNDNDNNNNNNNKKKKKNKSSSNSNNNHVYVYTDSIATIPKGINDNDAISTASAALCGVQCGMAVPVPVPMPKSDNTTSNKDEDGTSSDDDDDDDDENENETNDDSMGGKTVILGGGDYACFTAKALSALGIDVNLVTTRPMSLRDTPLNPLRGSNVNTMSPSIPNPNKIRYNSDDEVGFSEALGKFDTVIDTLGDEAKMDSGKSSGRKNKRTIQDGIDRFCGSVGIIEKLFRENQCTRYVSTLTRSQRFVLEEGILFARDPVLQYQNTIESDKELLSIVTPTSSSSKDDDDDEEEEEAMGENENYQILTPPRNYGRTIQKLFDQKIIYPADRNENGNHANKDAFVRGCSFPDYAEIEIWPQDSTDGAAVRFGFPGVQELTMEARMEKMMGAFDNNAGSGGGGGGSDVGTTAEQKKEREKKNKKQQNPFVIDIESLGDITEEIRNEKKDAVIFVSAPYCRLCRSIGPLYNRMARISKEELNSDIQFAKAVTGTSKAMKQLTFTLQIDSVPTFILFRKGEKYGESLGVTKLPSVKLNRAIESLKTGKEWDPEIADIDEGGQKMRTKL